MDFPVNILNDGETFANLDGCWIGDASENLSIEEFEQLLAEDEDGVPPIGYWSQEDHDDVRRIVFYTFDKYKRDVYLRIGPNLVSVAEIEKML